jgi:hypothetical protein
MTMSKQEKNEGEEDGPCVLDHPGHLFYGTVTSSNNKVTFILAVLVVHYN